MKVLFKYVVFVFLGTLILDCLYRTLCQWTYANPLPNSSILEGGNKFAYVSKKSDLVVLGASRAERHYAVNYIEDSLYLTAYNYGGAGCDIIQQYLSLLTCIKNGSPKIILLDLSTNQLSEEWIKEKNSGYYPFYWVNDSVKSIVEDVGGKKMRFLLLSAFVQYNSKMSYVLLRLLRQKSSNVDIEGFRPLPYNGFPAKYRTYNGHGGDEEEIVYSQTALKYLKRIVDVANSNNIELVICYSPSLRDDYKEINNLRNLCHDYNVKFWDFSNAITDPYLFKDENHLNERGANEFTKVLIKELKKKFEFPKDSSNQGIYSDFR